MKHIPERLCACCRASHPKSQLIRVVRNAEGHYIVDKTFKVSGRGAYICKSPVCLARLIKTRALNKSFKANVPDGIYSELAQMLEGEK